MPFCLYPNPYHSLYTLSSQLMPYHYRFICGLGEREAITLFRIFSKIAKESFFWGLGTAVGELPPYFFARGGNLIFKYWNHFINLRSNTIIYYNIHNKMKPPILSRTCECQSIFLSSFKLPTLANKMDIAVLNRFHSNHTLKEPYLRRFRFTWCKWWEV